MISNCYGITRWPLVFGLVLGGLMTARSTNTLYATVGEDITIICPIAEVFSWTFLNNRDFLAFCGENNSINIKSKIAERLNVSSNCRLTISRFVKDDVGEYKCSHPTKIYNGKKSHIISVQLRNSFLIKNKSQVFNTGEKPRVLKCEVSGVPSTYKFNKWRHLVNGELVRFLDGQDDEFLVLPYNNTSDIQYDDSGLYICNVTNNIGNDYGQLWQTGTVNVTIRDKPVLAKPLKHVYTVQNISSTSINIYLLSSSRLLASGLLNDGNGRVEKTQCAASTVNTNFHGTPVNVSGYVCNLSITESEGENFHNYSFTVSNDCCSNTFNFSIRSGRKPVTPKVLDYTSSPTWIYVIMEPGSDGGLHQEFIIEYRKQRNKKWKWLLVENDGTPTVCHYISSLDPSTAYEFMLFARNSIGNSSSTETYRVLTKGTYEKKSFWIVYTVVMIVATVLAVPLITFIWRRRKAKKNVSHRSQIPENSDQGGAIENSIFQSASDLTEPSTASSKPEIVNRSIDRRKTDVNRQVVGYSIVEKKESTRRFDSKELKYRDEKNIRYNSTHLNYIEVVFDPVEATSKFHIHGADNRTPYADIDCSLTADPLTSSDDESVSPTEDNNDFVSLEDVQQWNIHED